MDVTELLPHRYPFLLIDRVVELQPQKRAVAIKNVSHDEPVFQGHFPGLPLFPGVLQIECMAQTAGICFGQGEEGMVGVLAAVQQARFLRPVRPGDQLRIEASILHMRHGFGKAEASITCDGVPVASAQITFALRARSQLQGEGTPR